MRDKTKLPSQLYGRNGESPVMDYEDIKCVDGESSHHAKSKSFLHSSNKEKVKMGPSYRKCISRCLDHDGVPELRFLVYVDVAITASEDDIENHRLQTNNIKFRPLINHIGFRQLKQNLYFLHLWIDIHGSIKALLWKEIFRGMSTDGFLCLKRPKLRQHWFHLLTVNGCGTSTGLIHCNT